jgi:hypothetical protein
MKHMKGINFPAGKQDLIEHARNGEGPDTGEVVQFLEKLPDREYGGVQEVTKEIGKVDRGEEDGTQE